MRGTAAAIALGVVADAVLGDPRRFHPVAGFGTAAARLERLLYRDARPNGAVFAAVAVGVPTAAAVLLERTPLRQVALAAATWAALGGTSLAREGILMQRELDAGDLAGARDRLSHLCARDATFLDEDGLARATVESLAENTSDAAVAPLLFAAFAGLPGVVAYRCANTLDAMVGYRSPRYERFGWASARLDDLLNLVPSRVTAALAALLAPLAGGTTRAAVDAWRRDAWNHPSPNAGQVEAAFAGALDVTLGGANVYGGAVEVRPSLGTGPAPGVGDLADAVRLSRLTVVGAAALAVLLTWGAR